MARTRKYLNLTDTDIDEVISIFNTLIKLADSDEFYNYINEYHSVDLEDRPYDATEIITFCNYIFDFVSKKRDKLRVKTDLKLNKDDLFSLIFTDETFKLNKNIRFWVNVLLDYNFSQYEIYDYLDNMEESYRSMYEKYLSEYDQNNTESTY